MNQKCEELKALAADYVEGWLDEEQTRQFEQDLANCPEVKEEVRQLTLLQEEFNNAKGLAVPVSSDAQFYHMLENSNKPSTPANWMYVAASIALLLIGGVLGAWISRAGGEGDQMMALQQDVQYMKQLLMTAMLEEQSANDRIKAVSFAEDIYQPDVEVIKVLVNSLNTDRSPNVRIAAANALEKWQENALVRSELVRSMEYQHDPIVQITLINMLIGMKEKSAIKSFKKVAEDEKTEQLVRDQALIGIEVLI